MLRDTTGRLYSVAGAGALIAAVHITLMLVGPIDSDDSESNHHAHQVAIQ